MLTAGYPSHRLGTSVLLPSTSNILFLQIVPTNQLISIKITHFVCDANTPKKQNYSTSSSLSPHHIVSYRGRDIRFPTATSHQKSKTDESTSANKSILRSLATIISLIGHPGPHARSEVKAALRIHMIFICAILRACLRAPRTNHR